LKEERRKMQAEINRLTFESAIQNPLNTTPLENAGQADTKATKENQSESFESLVPFVFNALSDAQARLATLEAQIAAPQSELDRLTRQFWVTKEQVKANKYDLSASRYRQVDADAVYHEKPSVTLERLARLEEVILDEIQELSKLVNDEQR
jgi:type I restriction enzyme M protein